MPKNNLVFPAKGLNREKHIAQIYFARYMAKRIASQDIYSAICPENRYNFIYTRRGSRSASSVITYEIMKYIRHNIFLSKIIGTPNFA